jgi:hypothetical protein
MKGEWQHIASMDRINKLWEWQYNGVAPMTDIITWCDMNLHGDTWHYNRWETICFFDKGSYVLFLLRWS